MPSRNQSCTIACLNHPSILNLQLDRRARRPHVLECRIPVPKGLAANNVYPLHCTSFSSSSPVLSFVCLLHIEAFQYRKADAASITITTRLQHMLQARSLFLLPRSQKRSQSYERTSSIYSRGFRPRLLDPLHFCLRDQIALFLIRRIDLMLPCEGIDGGLVVKAIADASEESGVA